MVKRALLLIGLAGCSGIDHAQMDGVTNMPDDSSLSITGGTMHTGIAAAFTPRVWTRNWHDGTDEETSGIEVESSSTGVVGVAHVTDDSRVVLYAVGPGKATVSITLDGNVARSFEVTVTDPPQ
jgi:hypothetical protein